MCTESASRPILASVKSASAAPLVIRHAQLENSDPLVKRTAFVPMVPAIQKMEHATARQDSRGPIATKNVLLITGDRTVWNAVSARMMEFATISPESVAVHRDTQDPCAKKSAQPEPMGTLVKGNAAVKTEGCVILQMDPVSALLVTLVLFVLTSAPQRSGVTSAVKLAIVSIQPIVIMSMESANVCLASPA